VGIGCRDSGPQCWRMSPRVENSPEEEKPLDLKLKQVWVGNKGPSRSFGEGEEGLTMGCA